MKRLWWQLPGPSHFVSRVINDLRDGKNVILRLPDYVPAGLSDELRNLSEVGSWCWHTLRPEKRREPLDLLYSRFVSKIPTQSLRNASSFAAEKSSGGHIVWLDGLTEETWEGRWKRFLEDYEPACRACPPGDRILFCAPLVGELALHVPSEDVCLAHHHYLGFIERLDMLLFTARIMHGKRLPQIQKQIAIAIIMRVSGWDPATASRFASETLANILNPRPVLEEIAQERKWEAQCLQLQFALAWSKGIREIVEGRELVHSAALVLDRKETETSHRIWSAEVGVMLPYVEEIRRDLLRRLAPFLTVPYTTRYGETISNQLDLELGHIYAQIMRKPVVDSKLHALVTSLREIRNRLAHLETLDPSLVCSDDIAYFT